MIIITMIRVINKNKNKNKNSNSNDDDDDDDYSNNNNEEDNNNSTNNNDAVDNSDNNDNNNHHHVHYHFVSIMCVFFLSLIYLNIQQFACLICSEDIRTTHNSSSRGRSTGKCPQGATVTGWAPLMLQRSKESFCVSIMSSCRSPVGCPWQPPRLINR